MLIKILLVGLVMYMIFNLFTAMKIMMKNDPDGAPMSKYIARRVFTSVAIMIVVLLALTAGLIDPNPRPY